MFADEWMCDSDWDGPFDDAYDRRARRRAPILVTCKFCGATGFRWQFD